LGILRGVTSFGEVMRKLMERRGVTGIQLAQDIGITATSVSRLLNGASRPRQLTLTRIMHRLCVTPQEEQLVHSAFAGTRVSACEEPRAPFRPTPQDEIERVTRYMEVKSMSVAFELDVEAILTRSGLRFTRYFRNDPFVTDFLIEADQRRLAVECKYNVNRDWDGTVVTARLLREQLPCNQVLIVVPYINDLTRNRQPDLEAAGGTLIAVADLASLLAEQKGSEGWIG